MMSLLQARNAESNGEEVAAVGQTMSVGILSTAVQLQKQVVCLQQIPTINPHYKYSKARAPLPRLRLYGRRTCSKKPRVDRRKCDQQSRPSTSLIDNTVDFCGAIAIFFSPEFQTKFQREVPLCLEIPKFL